GVLPTAPANPSSVCMARMLLEGPAVHRVDAGQVSGAREDLELVRDAHRKLERAFRVREALLEVELQTVVEPLADAHAFRGGRLSRPPRNRALRQHAEPAPRIRAPDLPLVDAELLADVLARVVAEQRARRGHHHGSIAGPRVGRSAAEHEPRKLF